MGSGLSRRRRQQTVSNDVHQTSQFYCPDCNLSFARYAPRRSTAISCPQCASRDVIRAPQLHAAGLRDLSIAGSDALDATVQESIAQAHRVLRDLRRLFDTASRLLEGNASDEEVRTSTLPAPY